VARREDPELSQLLSRFVCVRIVQAWGLDLSLFQFDYGLTWAALFMNADRTVYGRYGSRFGERTGREVSVEGFKKALQGALELHAAYPGNKAQLAGKKGPAPAFPRPEAIPWLKGKPNVRPADGTRGNCVHCHQIQDGTLWSLRDQGQALPDHVVWPYPSPELVGLSLDPKERALATSVDPESPAGKGGFRAGDRIVTLDGQPILSVADVQWVLHHARDPVTLRAELERGGARASATLALEAGWRKKGDFTWRVVTWSLRHRLLGTEPLQPVSADERRALGVPANALALRVKGFPPDWVKEQNRAARQKFRPGDVLVEVDGRRDLPTEAALLGYLVQKKPPGSSADFTVLREGRRERVTLTVP
jgi:membrane-associated protease RseP (regulator of RpoE activity)